MKQSQSPSDLSTAQSKAKAILIGQANRRADVAVKLRQLADKSDIGFSSAALKRLAVPLQSGLAELVGEFYYDTSGNRVDCVRNLDPAGREIFDYMGATSRLLQDEKKPADFADLLRKLADGIEGKLPAAATGGMDGGFYSPKGIAIAMGNVSSADAIRKALRRLLADEQLPGKAWLEVKNPTNTQPKILFKLSEVRLFLSRFEVAKP